MSSAFVGRSKGLHIDTTVVKNLHAATTSHSYKLSCMLVVTTPLPLGSRMPVMPCCENRSS